MRRQRVCAKFIRFKEMAFLNVENKNDCFPKPSKGRISSISQWSIISDATSFNVFIKLSNADNSSLLFPWKKKKKWYVNLPRQHSGFSLLICSPEPGGVMATNHVRESLRQEAIRNLKSSIVSLSSMKTIGDDQLPFMHGEMFSQEYTGLL